MKMENSAGSCFGDTIRVNNEYLEIQPDLYDEIVEDIKRRHLSRDNMPKLIIGTGLSVIYGIPGMDRLAEYLQTELGGSKETALKEMWERYSDMIIKKGLEAGLADLSQEEKPLVNKIKTLTAKYILESEEKLHPEILKRDTGFSRLLFYLSRTVSVNNKIIDIMTPNYDRIIEIVCDKLGIGVITGFQGNIYNRFYPNLLKHPMEIYNCRKNNWVRLFKPHGSINWICENGNEYLTNDYNILKEKADCIEIVTPGSSKYEVSLTNKMFRIMREDFNELLEKESQNALLFFGYGFNDIHFDAVFLDSFQRNVLVLAKDVKAEILGKALERKNITVFYHEKDHDFMIYKSKKYCCDRPLWDIDQFADVFLG